MTLHYGYDNLKFKNPAVTVGTFDGVHRGHRYVIEMLKKRASETGGESVVVTFEPHPKMVVDSSGHGVFRLTGKDEKIQLMEKENIDHLVLINFDRDLSRMDAGSFIGNILAGKIGTRHLLVGFNNHFGRMPGGSFGDLKKIAGRYGITSEILEPVMSEALVISSSSIRDALLRGRLAEANNLLGYSYFMNGTIVGGRQIGRRLGFPTANIRPDYPEKLIPKDGVYAVETILRGSKFMGVMSIGFNPTISRKTEIRTIEVNIFDFEGDAYGEKICVIFRYRLRDEVVFETQEQLADQIARDRKEALRLLNNQ